MSNKPVELVDEEERMGWPYSAFNCMHKKQLSELPHVASSESASEWMMNE
jgi:hypothetical protein